MSVFMLGFGPESLSYPKNCALFLVIRDESRVWSELGSVVVILGLLQVQNKIKTKRTKRENIGFP